MDVVDLREFYASPLGNATRRLLAAKLKPRLGSLNDACVMGMGFATPYLDDLASSTGHSIAFMMARQGVIPWPPEGSVHSALVEEFGKHGGPGPCGSRAGTDGQPD